MYTIRKINGDEVEEALALALEVFMEFEAPDYSSEGVETFRSLVQSEDFIAKRKTGHSPVYAAFDKDKMIGIMGMRPNRTHINLAFVRREYHRQGVGTALFRYLLEDIAKDSPAPREVTVNSSPYGRFFYLHIGFQPLSEEQESDGIRYTPMKYKIPRHDAGIGTIQENSK